MEGSCVKVWRLCFCASHLAALRPTIWRRLEAAASLIEASVQYPPGLDAGVASWEATAVPLGNAHWASRRGIWFGVSRSKLKKLTGSFV